MMSYKTILVHCDAGKSVAARLDKAVALAEQHQAHLIGLHARPPFQPPVYDDGSFGMDMFYKDHETAVAASEAAGLARPLPRPSRAAASARNGAPWMAMPMRC